MRLALLVVALFVSPALAAAQDVDLFVDACRAGELSACNVAGLVFQTGAGEDADLGRAMDFYRAACDGGDATGCTSIGLMYQAGRGVERDRAVAAGQYQRACDVGDRFACDLLLALEAEGPVTERRPFFKTGRVIDAGTGAPLEGVLVDAPRLGLQVTSDAAGRVELGRVPEGTYGLAAELLGYEPVRGVLNVPGYAEFVLLLEPIPSLESDRQGQVMGIVADGRRAGIPGVAVDIMEHEGFQASTDPEGRFVLRGVPPGLWTVRVATSDGLSARTRIVVQPGRAARVDASVAEEGVAFQRPD